MASDEMSVGEKASKSYRSQGLWTGSETLDSQCVRLLVLASHPNNAPRHRL